MFKNKKIIFKNNINYFILLSQLNFNFYYLYQVHFIFLTNCFYFFTYFLLVEVTAEDDEPFLFDDDGFDGFNDDLLLFGLLDDLLDLLDLLDFFDFLDLF